MGDEAMTLTIDELRHQLRDTQNELRATKTALSTTDEDNKKLRRENDGLKHKMHKAVTTLLPEGTSLSDNWDDYKGKY